MNFLFIGEKRSRRAIDMEVKWEHGRLCASTLFRALLACGIYPEHHSFRNLWYDDGELDPNTVRFARGAQPRVVALGRKVSCKLQKLGVAHVYLTHPAARGKIRTTRLYMEHVRRTLTGPLKIIGPRRGK